MSKRIIKTEHEYRMRASHTEHPKNTKNSNNSNNNNKNMTKPTHELNYKIEKIPSGYLGQCVEFPQVIVQAKTQPTLNKKVGIAIEGYLKACPEIHKTLNKTIGYAKYEIKKA